MKKIFLLICFVLCSLLPSMADVMPYSVNDINAKSIGVYQAENNIKIYKSPDIKSEVLYDLNWNEHGLGSSSIFANELFVAFIPKKNLGFLTVMDESDDMEWLQIAFKRNQLGWIKKEDPYRYSNWRNFFNDYGRKYGISYLKGTPDSSKNLYGTPDDEAKIISSVTLAKAIKLTNVSGNWVLAIIYDIDRSQKIGWLKWRTMDGEIFLFPNLR